MKMNSGVIINGVAWHDNVSGINGGGAKAAAPGIEHGGCEIGGMAAWRNNEKMASGGRSESAIESVAA